MADKKQCTGCHKEFDNTDYFFPSISVKKQDKKVVEVLHKECHFCTLKQHNMFVQKAKAS